MREIWQKPTLRTALLRTARQKTHCLRLRFYLFHPFSVSLSRYKNVERLAAEEYEKERVRVSRTNPDLNLTFEPSDAWPSSSRSSTPSSFASQEDAEAELDAEAPVTPSEAGKTTQNNV